MKDLFLNFQLLSVVLLWVTSMQPTSQLHYHVNSTTPELLDTLFTHMNLLITPWRSGEWQVAIKFPNAHSQFFYSSRHTMETCQGLGPVPRAFFGFRVHWPGLNSSSTLSQWAFPCLNFLLCKMWIIIVAPIKGCCISDMSLCMWMAENSAWRVLSIQ